MAAATALAGLLLVFIGEISAGYDSHDSEAKPAVVSQYKRRARLALTGFFLALAAAGAALVGRWAQLDHLVIIGIASLAGSLVFVSIAAWQMVGDIS